MRTPEKLRIRASDPALSSISKSKTLNFLRRDTEMKKMLYFAFAVALFAPVAATMALQAAQIVG